MVVPWLSRSSVLAAVSLILFTGTTIAQYVRTQVPQKAISRSELSTNDLSQPVTETIANPEIIDVINGVWCGRHIQSCPK